MKLTTNQLLFISCGFTFSMLIFRIVYKVELRFSFLVWNLFLAYLPYLLSQKALASNKNAFVKWFWFLASIAFLPNAPYILTDLFHLRWHYGSSIWFDTLLIFSFAINGLWLFYLSLYQLRTFLAQHLSKMQTYVTSFFLIFISAFGMYLGRYLRFNSWDVLTNPIMLVYEISDRIIHPFAHSRTWGMTVCYFGFLAVGYLIFINLKSEDKINEAKENLIVS